MNWVLFAFVLLIGATWVLLLRRLWLADRLRRELLDRPPLRIDLELVTGPQLIDELGRRREPTFILIHRDEEEEWHARAVGLEPGATSSILLAVGAQLRDRLAEREREREE